MAINSNSKGKKGELELSKILREHGYDTRRGQQYCGANGDADVIGLPYVHIECKRVEKLTWMPQWTRLGVMPKMARYHV